jgi:serine protease inhibitor
MRLNAIHSIAFAASLAVASACSGGTAPGRAPALLTALPRALTDREKSIVSANDAFTLALFQRASRAEPAKNVFISPLSASMALGMTMNGARNATFDAMRTTLQYGDMSQADINAGYKSLISLLTGLDPSVESRVANSVWVDKSLALDPSFVTTVAAYFDAQASTLDFTNTTASLHAINTWVNQETASRIPTLLDTIDPDEVMFLINAIYFKGSWRYAFDRSATQTATFTSGSGAVQRVPMMHLDSEQEFAGSMWPDGTSTVELPYGNAAFTMRVFLPPDTSSVESFISRLTPERLTQGGVYAVHKLQLWMPRVTLDYERKLNDDLKALGMDVAFTDAADFSGISGSGGLSISRVLQKTFLSIDEEGTEAAAATAVGFQLISAPVALTIRCDRPYVILIRERLSGTVLFVGKINTIP